MEERHDLLHGAGSINTLGASTSHTTPAAVDMEEEEEEAVKKEEERWVGSGEWRDAFKCDGGSSSRSLERGGLDWTRDRATIAGWLYICVCIIMYISVYLTYIYMLLLHHISKKPFCKHRDTAAVLYTIFISVLVPENYECY